MSVSRKASRKSTHYFQQFSLICQGMPRPGDSKGTFSGSSQTVTCY